MSERERLSRDDVRLLAQEALKRADDTLALGVGASTLALLDELASLEARLREVEAERDERERRANDWMRYHGAMQERTEAAEARLAAAEEALRKIAALPCNLDCDVTDSRLFIDGDCASCFAGLALPAALAAVDDTPPAGRET